MSSPLEPPPLKRGLADKSKSSPDSDSDPESPLTKKQKTSMDRDAASDHYHTILRCVWGLLCCSLAHASRGFNRGVSWGFLEEVGCCYQSPWVVFIVCVLVCVCTTYHGMYHGFCAAIKSLHSLILCGQGVRMALSY